MLSAVTYLDRGDLLILMVDCSELQRLLLSLPVEQWNQLFIRLCHFLHSGIHVTETGRGHLVSG